ncbi:uncharacterized protein LOC130628782 [Hydractinia symbiolongicarpus]|uniref:uncharacterized protein LOC130628782 n=1 Tax=Hydractinia symbiolongicarpus TaxID=13093 RepID=UPI00254BBC25|nr:uncharacterized protein LOC130628782 [Hydractinia symbiolongicarpus]
MWQAGNRFTRVILVATMLLLNVYSCYIMREQEIKKSSTNTNMNGRRRISAIPVCTHKYFTLLLFHLCKGQDNHNRRTAIKDFTIHEKKATEFLKLRRGVVKPDLSHGLTYHQSSSSSDIYFLDECCVNKGCDLKEITEYCT